MPILALLFCFSAAVIGYLKGDPSIWIPYAFINPLIFFSPRIVFTFIPSVQKRLSNHWLNNIERIGLGILLVNIPGSLYLHDLGIQYDRILHLSVAYLVFYVVFLVLSPIFTKLPDNIDKIKALSIAGFVTSAGLFAWEGMQFSSDKLFGTHLFFDVVQPIARDVTEDILFGLAGTLLAISLFHLSKKTWRKYAVDSFN